MQVIILDYSTVSTYVYDVDEEVFESYARNSAIESYIEALGHNPSQCSWMFHNSSINIYNCSGEECKVPMYEAS